MHGGVIVFDREGPEEVGRDHVRLHSNDVIAICREKCKFSALHKISYFWFLLTCNIYNW